MFYYSGKEGDMAIVQVPSVQARGTRKGRSGHYAADKPSEIQGRALVQQRA